MFDFVAVTKETEQELRTALTRLKKNIHQAPFEIGDIAYAEMQNQLRPHNYNSTAYDSIDIVPQVLSDEFVEVTVGPNEALWVYLGVLNSGRPSGTHPNIDALAEWIERRGFSGNASAREMAFILSKRIAERGTQGSGQGYHWFDTAAELAMPKMEEKSKEFIEVFG